jgi:translin
VAGTSRLDEAMPRILERFAARNEAREEGLAACRTIIRLSANAIRAVHRGDFETAGALLADARRAHTATQAALAPHPDVYHAGFRHDAEKELAEAETTFSLLSGGEMPGPEDLGVSDAAWLNGIAEAIGELRRWILDRLRRGDDTGCEAMLGAMDDIYSVLVTVDFPDAMTGGLRRTTDQARGILERTRGDLTMAIVQRRAVSAMGAEPAWAPAD